MGWKLSAEAGASEPQWADRLWRGNQPAGSPVVSEEQFDLLSTLDLRQEMPTPRVSKSFLSMRQASPNPL